MQHPTKEIPASRFLHAVRTGNLTLIRNYLEQDGCVNARDKNNVSALMMAIGDYKVEVIEELLNHPELDVVSACSTPDLQSSTPYEYAMQLGLTDMADAILNAYEANFWRAIDLHNWTLLRRYLSQPGFDVGSDSNNRNGLMAAYRKYSMIPECHDIAEKIKDLLYAPFFRAVKSGDLETINAFFSLPGFDVNVKDKYGRTALIIAIKNKREGAVLWKLINAAEVDLLTPYFSSHFQKFTPHDYAIALGFEDIAHDIRVIEQDRVHALFEAVRINAVEQVKEYIKFNTGKPAAFNMYHPETALTPLSLAGRLGHLEIVKAFMAEPAVDVNKGCPDINNNVLMFAAKAGQKNVVEFVLASGRIDPAAKNALDQDAEELAGKNDEVRKMLHVANQNKPSSALGKISGPQFLKAAWLGNVDVVKLYIQQNIDDVNALNVRTNSVRKYTALMLASGRGRAEIVRILLNTPCVNPNLLTGETGITALMFAAYMKCVSCVKELVNSPRVLLTATTKDGLSAVDFAKHSGKKEISHLIREAIRTPRLANFGVFNPPRNQEQRRQTRPRSSSNRF